MCAIIDANVTFEVFGKKQTEAGMEFRNWLDGDQGSLVIGGRNLKELSHNGNFSRWFLEARRMEGRVHQIKESEISKYENTLVQCGDLKSDDEHIIALALATNARLLYSNDKNLIKDFCNRLIIDNPRGKVYSTNNDKKFNAGHKKLLDENNCIKSLPNC